MKQKLESLREHLPKLGAYQKYFLKSLLFLAIASIALMWFLEYRYFLNNSYRAWHFMTDHSEVFLYNAMILFLLIVLIWALVGKPGTAVGLSWIILIGVTYAHINKYMSREQPLLPEDFALADQASSLAKFVQFDSIIKLILAMAIVAGLTILFNRTLAKKLGLVYKSSAKSFAHRHRLATRSVTVILAMLLLLSSTEFARHNDGSRYTDIPFLGTHFTAWNQNRNYDDNGFILGFLYNMQKLQLDAPETYSESTMKEIHEQYSKIAEKENKKRSNPKDEDVNVVIILNETFYDPSVKFNGKSFEDYYPHSGGDILPNLHKLAKKYPSGYMYSLDYGGGTANIEFETFTSLTNHWINAVPYTSLIPKAGPIPSVARYLGDHGFETTAIHPYNGGMYKRNISLKNEGFDTFITQSEMKHTEHDGNSQYINDRSAYQEVLDVIKESDKKQTIGLMTMQNHTPYNHDNYEKTEFKSENTDIDEDKKLTIETYYQTIHSSDAYLGEFIDELDKLDEKTVVLFFGDHSAGIFDITNSHQDKKVRDLSRLTPYFLYANFDDAFDSYDPLPTTTPNCMVNEMFNRLNWQKDTQYYLVDQVCKVEPILTNTWLEGRNVKSEPALQKYELLTYDILGGKQYWLKLNAEQ